VARIPRVQKYQMCERCVSVGKGTVGSEGIRNGSMKGGEIGKGDVGAGKLARGIWEKKTLR